MEAVTLRRPVLRYHGGKWRLASWVLSFFPPHRIYVEPFGGAASVLMRKPRSYAEVYNDLDSEVVNVFRVLRNPLTAKQLRELLTLTPFSRVEFEAAYQVVKDPIERARRTIIKSFMGFGSGSIHDSSEQGLSSPTWKAPTGYRANSNRSGTTPAHDWHHYPDSIEGFCERLRGVVVEHRPAEQVITAHDRAETLHYVDPPYVWDTRSKLKRRRQQRAYRHEMSNDDHRRLAQVLHNAAGMVLLSGYPCDLYDRELFPTWERHERASRADGALKRTEVVWLNPAASQALRAARSQTTMVLEAAQ